MSGSGMRLRSMEDQYRVRMKRMSFASESAVRLGSLRSSWQNKKDVRGPDPQFCAHKLSDREDCLGQQGRCVSTALTGEVLDGHDGVGVEVAGAGLAGDAYLDLTIIILLCVVLWAHLDGGNGLRVLDKEAVGPAGHGGRHDLCVAGVDRVVDGAQTAHDDAEDLLTNE